MITICGKYPSQRIIQAFLLYLAFGAAPAIVQAEVLYQWFEADGSLTFSPTPPPEGSGIKYKVMNSAGDTANGITLADNPQSAKAVASAKVPVLAPKPEPAPAAQVLAYAPSTPSAKRSTALDLPSGISRVGTSTDATPSHSKANSANQGSTENGSAQLQASKQKSQHCSDLGKRIVALENRITHSNTNQEMDQVILQISRYQKSYSSHCE